MGNASASGARSSECELCQQLGCLGLGGTVALHLFSLAEPLGTAGLGPVLLGNKLVKAIMDVLLLLSGSNKLTTYTSKYLILPKNSGGGNTDGSEVPYLLESDVWDLGCDYAHLMPNAYGFNGCAQLGW